MDIIKYDLPKNSSTNKGGSAAVYSGGVGGVSAEAMEAALAHYLRKDADDVAQGIIRFLSEQKLEGGATFGNYFAGLDGAGGKVDRNGDGELNSMMIRQSLRIGDAYLCYDEDNHALKVYGANDGVMNLYALGGVSALGQSSVQGGGGGTSYNRLDSWASYDASKAGWVLSALLGNDLNSRVTSLENGQIEGVATQEWVQNQGYLTELSAATINALGAIKIGYSANGKNYPVLLDNINRAYVSVPWSDTTYGVFGASANGLVPMASAANKVSAETAVGNYYLCADGKFRQLPANAFNNTWRPLGTGATDACAGDDARLSDARPASDVYAWAKASTKPTYTLDEVADGSSRKLSNYLPLSGGTISNASFGKFIIERSGSANMAAIGFKNSLGTLGYFAVNTVNGSFVRYKADTSAFYTILDSANSSVSLSGSTLTVKINGTEKSLANTWRGIQDNLTSSTNTTESLSAKQGYLLANGSARDNTKLPLSGGTMSNTNVVTNLNADLLDGQHGAYYAKAVDVTTLQGYFTNGVANNADKLDNHHSSDFWIKKINFNHDLAYYGGSYGTVGSIAIKLPNLWTNSMNTYVIQVSEYGIAEGTITVYFYNYTSNNFINQRYHVSGKYTKGVWLASDSNNIYILLGAKDTNWTYPQVYLKEVLTGFGNTDKWSSGYSISLMTDTSVFSQIVKVNEQAHSISITGNAATATTLATPRTIWGQSFDGSANVSGAMSGVTSVDGLLYFDTTTGFVKISGSSHSPLVLNSTSTYNYLYFRVNDINKANIGWFSDNLGLIMQCGSNFVSLASTGDLKKNGSYKFWHEGNDGSGSGLDADMVDGLHVQDAGWLNGIVARRGMGITLDNLRYVKIGTLPIPSVTAGGESKFIAKIYGTINIGEQKEAEYTLVGSTRGSIYCRLYHLLGKKELDAYTRINGDKVEFYIQSNATYQGTTSIYIATCSDTFAYDGTSTNGNLANMSGYTKADEFTYALEGKDPDDCWSDGTHARPWYGYDRKYTGGIYSTTLSDYYGITLKTSLGLLCMDVVGNVGIGTTSPNYKLDVAGVIHSSVGMFSDGYVSALGQNTSSDERLKDVQGDINVSIDVLANAPSKLFEWKDNKALGAQVGTIAQYWQRALPQVVHDRGDGYLSMQYDVAALLGTITIAKRVQNHEERIKELERENEALREQLKEFKG